MAAALLILGCWAGARGADNQVTEVAVETQHPRLFLNAARLRLLKRERERDSERWRQLESVVKGGAPEEPGLALALYSQVVGDTEAGRRAAAFALDPALDPAGNLRQMALAFDWLHEALSDTQRRDLAARLAKGMAALDSDQSVAAASARALAAIALDGDYPDAPEAELNRVVQDWWAGRIAPALVAGRDVIPRDDALALFELLHAVRDATGVDLRRACPRYFANLPTERLMSYYPAAYRDGEGRSFRAGAERAAGAPDAHLAALSRAADLAMVAFDPDLQGSQWLQGWLMHDPYAMRDAFGATYEFLWANPYQPGLSYYQMPLAYYDGTFGKLFVRSSWDDGAAWLGCWDGVAQKFANGRVTAPDAAEERFDAAVVEFGAIAEGFRVQAKAGQRLFVARLEPGRTYRVEMEGEKPVEARADAGGILELKAPAGKEVKVMLR